MTFQFARRVSLCIAQLALVFGLSAQGAERTFFHPFFKGTLQGKVLVSTPDEGPTHGDILFFTGYYDRPDNHRPLFSAWNKLGFRVISFAYPSHDENSGPRNFLSFHNFASLFEMIEESERATREDQSRPLFLAGWSLGGELAVRFVQSGEYRNLGRPIQGMVLLAPSVAVLPIVGEWNIATRRTLTDNAEHPFGGPLKPRSPLIHLPFTASLVGNTLLAHAQTLPADIPTLVMLSGRDKYVWTWAARRWAETQLKRGAEIYIADFKDVLHMLDTDEEVIAQASLFPSDICKRLLK